MSDPKDETEDLVAYLDGELTGPAAEAMATRLTLEPKLRAEAEALQRTWDALDILPRPAPSPTFATRTLSQAVPAMATQPMPAVRGGGGGFWEGSAVLVLIAAVGGFLVDREIHPAPPAKSPDPELRDVPLMKNLRLYRNADDLEYVEKLDSPEFFGEGE